MANEVIIEEYERFDVRMQCPGEWITTQVLDTGVASAVLNPRTRYIRIVSKDAGFWYTMGVGANATANTAGNSWIPANDFRDHFVGTGIRIDTA